MSNALAVIAIAVSIMTLLVVLVLLGRRDFRYAEPDNDPHGLMQRLEDLGRGQSQIYRYLEAVDEQTGGHAYQVLSSRVPEHPAQVEY